MEDLKEKLPLSSLLPNHQPPIPDPLSMDFEIWMMAEKRIQEILYVVQPNIASDKRRKEIINHVRRLINEYFGSEVLAFGSVPLKTYLPDGDVDLTVFCYQHLAEDFAREVCNALKSEEGPEFRVKDIQYIDAQVKVVKCTVKGGTAVDISFNQISGLCTLCFLEQADQLIGKNHLFKRSVLLIKAWCYYESRLLGAHHGLLSTYALETMVLYVIGLYHESLRGPLEVLYRFLDYYTRFDWDKCCLTIHGPVELSSLTKGIAEAVEGDGKETFLSKEFLQNCRDMFAVAIKAHEGELHEFLVKHLNILDPLNDNNNLGRSVSLGSYYRIVPAFAHGLKKLRDVLMLPGVMMGEGLEKFFEYTLARNGRGERPDLPFPVPPFGTGKFEYFDFTGDSDSYYGGLRYSQMYSNYTYVWDENSLAWTLQPNQSALGGAVVNDVLVADAPPFHPSTSKKPAANHGPSKPRRSRGTGPYIPESGSQFKVPEMVPRFNVPEMVPRFNIPEMVPRFNVPKASPRFNVPEALPRPNVPEVTHSSPKDTHNRGKKKNPDSTRQSLGQRSGQKSDRTDGVKNPTGIVKEEKHCSFDLSLESFPPLHPTSGASPSKISETVDLRQAETAHQGFSWPVVFPPEPAIEPTNSSPLSLPSSARDIVIMGPQKQPEPAEIVKETAPVQLYELKDDKDFPPL